MASNKNQHFVPRCYFKPFSNYGDGNTINLFNIERLRSIHNAPLKSQCAKNYFYGQNLRIEKSLQIFESAYAETVRRIMTIDYTPNHSDLQNLAIFWCLQYLRTESIAKRTVAAARDMIDEIGSENPDHILTMKEAIEISIGMIPKAWQTIRDLKSCIIKNTTNVPFVTSDDPAILANRWHQKDSRTKDMAFGLSSAGAIAILPISPKFLFMMYDSDVYNFQQYRAQSKLDRTMDIASLNEHQHLNAYANIYYHEESAAKYIEQSFLITADRRPAIRHKLHHAVFDHAEGNNDVFRSVSAEEARNHERTMIHQETVRPVPKFWPSNLKFRPEGKVWFNGSGAGYCRKAAIPEGSTDYAKYPSRRKG